MKLISNLAQIKFYIILAAVSLIPFVNISHVQAITIGGIEIDELDNIPGIDIFQGPQGEKGDKGDKGD